MIGMWGMEDLRNVGTSIRNRQSFRGLSFDLCDANLPCFAPLEPHPAIWTPCIHGNGTSPVRISSLSARNALGAHALQANFFLHKLIPGLLAHFASIKTVQTKHLSARYAWCPMFYSGDSACCDCMRIILTIASDGFLGRYAAFTLPCNTCESS